MFVDIVIETTTQKSDRTTYTEIWNRLIRQQRKAIVTRCFDPIDKRFVFQAWLKRRQTRFLSPPTL